MELEWMVLKAEWIEWKGEWMILKAKWIEWKGEWMDRMEERQKCFEEETRNNFADIKLHLENITDRNLSILAENYQNVIDKMNVPITWMNRVMMNEIRINSLTERVSQLEQSHS